MPLHCPDCQSAFHEADPAIPSIADAASFSQTELGGIRLALALARRGLGQTAPNPSVGAVVVAGDQLVAAAVTARGGRPHAEPQALDAAGPEARGATLVVTLEPCVHQGVTPPCVQAILRAGIGRVIVGALDPDTRVVGRGVAQLRVAGVEVVMMPARMTQDAEWLALGHRLRVSCGRPFVQAKVALGSDGRVPCGTGGAPRFVSSVESRAFSHLLRAEVDAILVGRGTLDADDPQLNCRLPGMAGRSPLRIVVSSDGAVPRDARVRAGDAPMLVACAADAAASDVDTIAVARSPGGGLDLAALLRGLATRGLTRILVEGGPTLVASFLRAGLVDELVIIRAALAAGPDSLPFDSASNALPLVQTLQRGGDGIDLYRRPLA